MLFTLNGATVTSVAHTFETYSLLSASSSHSVGIPMGRRRTFLVSAYDDNVGYGSFPVEFVVTSSMPCEIALGLQWLAFFRALNHRGVSTPGKF